LNFKITNEKHFYRIFSHGNFSKTDNYVHTLNLKYKFYDLKTFSEGEKVLMISHDNNMTQNMKPKILV